MHNMDKIKGIIGIITFISFTLALIWGIKLFTPEPKQPTEGIPHNYYHPDVWKKNSTKEFQFIPSNINGALLIISQDSINKP